MHLCSINPVTGRVEEKQPNPMDGMTDEQKEYEAMKLVSMFDKLSRWGIHFYYFLGRFLIKLGQVIEQNHLYY